MVLCLAMCLPACCLSNRAIYEIKKPARTKSTPLKMHDVIVQFLVSAERVSFPSAARTTSVRLMLEDDFPRGGLITTLFPLAYYSAFNY